MLQLKTFLAKEDDKMNEFLKTHIRPKDADVLIAGEYLVVSYEDGESPSTIQKILFKEQLKTLEQYRLHDFFHTKRLAEVKISGVNKETEKNNQKIKELKTKREALDKKKDQKEYTELGVEIKGLEKELGQFKLIIANQEGIIKGQQANITESMIEISVLDEEIGYLETDLANEKERE